MSEMMMPCSYEAEQAVLGGLMLDNDRWDEVILQISPEDLFSRPHRMVFRVMAELAGEGLPLDLITIPEEQAQLVLLSLQKVMARQQLSNPVGWLLAVMKKAREGRLYAPRQGGDISDSVGQKTVQRPEQQQWKPEPRASARPVSEENIRDLVKKIREKIINS